MANWLRHVSQHSLTSQVPRLPHHPQCLRRYSTAQQVSFAPGNDNSHGNQVAKRKAWNPTAHGQVLSASGLRDGFTDVETTLGRLRIEASHGSMEGGTNAKLLADHLIRVLGVKPGMRIYSALILANCREEGSVAEVKALIRDLRADGLDLDSSACHDVLKVYIDSRNKHRWRILIALPSRFFPSTLTTSYKPRSSITCNQNGST